MGSLAKSMRNLQRMVNTLESNNVEVIFCTDSSDMQKQLEGCSKESTVYVFDHSLFSEVVNIRKYSTDEIAEHMSALGLD